MGGIFGVAAKDSCVMDLFFGVDYHSHLGTKRGGMTVCDGKSFNRVIHNIENSPFRTKFEYDVEDMHGNLGIGCISDKDPQPLLIQSHLGSFALTTVGKISNKDNIVKRLYKEGMTYFLEQSGGSINETELVAALINRKPSIEEGIEYAKEVIEGSMSMLIMTSQGIYAARDKNGRTPLIIGRKDTAYCVTFESYAYLNLGYTFCRELGPSEVVFINPDGIKDIALPCEYMSICAFLWVYYGYPTATYEGRNVEQMRYISGSLLAGRDDVSADIVAGVPDSGTAHAIGYANESGISFARPFIKYTPTWPRSFMPTRQDQRKLVARMKLIPVEALIRGKNLLLIDDSIVRGTQLRETTDFLYHSGARDVHVRPACPPVMFPCKYLNFSRSNSAYDLIARRIIREREGDDVSDELLCDYANPDSRNYREMVEKIRKQQNFTTLRYQRLDDLIKSIGLPECRLCTYCWSGHEK